MTTPPVHVERRVGQRFAYNLPVSLHEIATGAEGLGFTQDLSSRGAFFFTDVPLAEGAEIELTLKMPSEITLGENMRVRCRGRVLRVVKPTDTTFGATLPGEPRASETKIGVAVCLHGYEYLPEAEDSSATFRRISALHSHLDEDQPSEPVSLRPPVAVH
ncbi:MAG: PilZ domain-containing protein [Candidatus Sulfotelmatobacter sp.]